MAGSRVKAAVVTKANLWGKISLHTSKLHCKDKNYSMRTSSNAQAVVSKTITEVWLNYQLLMNSPNNKKTELLLSWIATDAINTGQCHQHSLIYRFWFVLWAVSHSVDTQWSILQLYYVHLFIYLVFILL